MVSALVDCFDRNNWRAGLLANPAPALDHPANGDRRRPVVGPVSRRCAKRLQRKPAAGLIGPQTVMLGGTAASPQKAPLPVAQSDG